MAWYKSIQIGLSCLALSGCATLDALNPLPENYPDTGFEAGRVHLGLYPALDWYSISDQLRPGFKVKSADELRNDVLPVTSLDSTILQEAVSLKFGLDLATTAVSKSSTSTTTTDTDAAGQVLTTATGQSTRTQTTEPGETSLEGAAAGAPQAIAPAATLDLAAALGLGVDPFLRVRAQTALWQEIQLLNSYLDAEIAETNETPYLIRAQISVQPFARNIPYDVYTEIFVEKDGAAAKPRIIPLVVIDNSQRSGEKRLASAAQQLEATVSALVANKGLGIGRNRIRQQLRDLQSVGIDSAIMVGQSENDELTVRIGAPKSPGGSYEMVPRTYDVTFLVLWPKGAGTQARVRQFSSMRNSRTGERIPVFTPESRRGAIDEILSTVPRKLSDDCRTLFRYNLIDNVSKGNTADSKCMKRDGSAYLNWHSTSAEDGAVTGFMSRFGIEYYAELYQQLSDYFTARWPTGSTVYLPQRVPALPPAQTAILTDTGSGTATVALAGAEALNPKVDRLSAELSFSRQASAPATLLASVNLAASNIETSADGRVVASFASPGALGLLNDQHYGLPALTLASGGTRVASPPSASYAVILNQKAAPKQARLFDMTVLPAVVAIQPGGKTRVRVIFAKKPCDPKLTCPVIADYYLMVAGQMLQSVEKSGTAITDASFEVGKNAVIVAPDTPYDLIFSTPVADSTAKLSLIARNASKKQIEGAQVQDATITFKAAPSKTP